MATSRLMMPANEKEALLEVRVVSCVIDQLPSFGGHHVAQIIELIVDRGGIGKQAEYPGRGRQRRKEREERVERDACRKQAGIVIADVGERYPSRWLLARVNRANVRWPGGPPQGCAHDWPTRSRASSKPTAWSQAARRLAVTSASLQQLRPFRIRRRLPMLLNEAVLQRFP